MNVLYFNIYDYSIEIKSADFGIKNLKINADFAFFSTIKNEQDQLRIRISKLPLFTEAGIKIWQTRMCEVRQVSRHRRQLIYKQLNRTLAVVNDETQGNERHIELLAENIEVIDDILYFLINSCAGEFLDSCGLMRIHALSFKVAGRAQLVCGPPKSDKSTLALELLKYSEVQIFSDEVSLLDLQRKILLPFPVRIASPDLQTAAPLKLSQVFFLRNKNGTHSWTKFYFIFCIISGTGLTQMWEYLLRLNNFKTMFTILNDRIRLARFLNSFEVKTLNRDLPMEQIISAVF